jgi:hypothetical protein
MISLLRLLDIAGNAVPVVAELFLPDGIERLPEDPRLFAVSSLKTVAAAVTLSIFEPERAARLEPQLSGEGPES